ncbi:CalY family protein [Sporosarcina luteola]|uniref:CalY family protein n=1 Tax=Sporosarcina luteola TaxID=582850 RepID=UPI00203D28DB|nr:CalY family protein [Sporosarcina luteola]MCM3636604.1 CalY family protein [Sporosarcina luteola]
MIRLFRYFPILLLISIICLFPTTGAVADETNATDKKEVDISLSPKETLFDVSNMKPGDWAPRTLTVKNTGSKDFVYHMQLRNRTSGDDKLFNELLLEVKAGELELYQGKMAAFTSLSDRDITSGSEENLDITIRFPEHLGNDFQGLNAAFVFDFTAEGINKVAVHAMTKGMIDSGGIASSGFGLLGSSTKLFEWILFGSLVVASGFVLMIIRHNRRMKWAQ